MLRLVVTVGDRVRHFEVPPRTAGAMTLGSAADNDFVIVCPGVSRRHALLERDGNRVVLTDAGSKNGLVCHGRREERVRLAPGDAVQIGRAHVTVEEISSEDGVAGVVIDTRSSSHGDLARSTESSGDSGPAAALRWARAAEDAESLDAAARRRLLDEALVIAGADALLLFARAGRETVLRDVYGVLPPDIHNTEGRQWVRVDLQSGDLAAFHRGAEGRFVSWEREFLQHVAAKVVASASRKREAAPRAPELVFPEGMILGGSRAMGAVRERLQIAVRSELPVLLRGESGTGKELIARTIHQSGAGARRPFRARNCAAFAADLLEAELFGIRKGVATGVESRPGLFVEAEGGTVFLDEIGDMPASLQAKLLRVLQEREVVPIGASVPVKISVRIIASTHRDLEQMIRDGLFRSDLYHRLRGIEILLPPLRERGEDIPELITTFVARAARRASKRIRGVSRKALEIAASYTWPGNIRELETTSERAVLLCPSGGIIEAAHFDLPHQSLPAALPAGALHDRVDAMERDAILEALQKCGGNKSRVAKLLGITRGGLYLKMRRLRIK